MTTNESTIPTGFEPNSNSNYLKLPIGKHRIRILGGAITGWLWWIDQPDGGRKPKRIPLSENPSPEYADTVKKFMAFPIFNYEIGKIQIWEVSQSSIQQALINLELDVDWGPLKGYDLEVARVGTGMTDTKYTVTPKPKQEISEPIKKAVEDGLPELEALYVNADPFTWNPDAIDESLSDDELDKIGKVFDHKE